MYVVNLKPEIVGMPHLLFQVRMQFYSTPRRHSTFSTARNPYGDQLEEVYPTAEGLHVGSAGFRG